MIRCLFGDSNSYGHGACFVGDGGSDDDGVLTLVMMIENMMM